MARLQRHEQRLHRRIRHLHRPRPLAQFHDRDQFLEGNSIYVGAAVGAIFVSADLAAVGIKVFVRAYQIYTSPRFKIIRKVYAEGRAADVDIDGTVVIYEPTWSAQGFSLSFADRFLLGSKAFKSPAKVAKTVLHEVYRLDARTFEPIGQEYISQETKEADGFANMSFKNQMQEADDGESPGDEGSGEGVGSDG